MIGKLVVIGVVILAVIVFWLQQVQVSFEPESLRGKRVVITGASAGIGKQLAYQYAKHGANILITARREHVLKKVVAKCQELGVQSVHYIALDMSNPTDTERLIEEASSRLHGLDQLILNHVSYDHMGLWDGDVERLSRVMKVNFESYVSLASLAIPLLEVSNGSIGVVSSGSGLVGTPFAASYCSAKFALGGFFGTLRQEFSLTNKNISITLCMLGSIVTHNSMIAADKYYNPDLKTTPASDTAYAIMSGVTTRQRDIYYPRLSLRFLSLFRDWFPNVIDDLVMQMTKSNASQAE